MPVIREIKGLKPEDRMEDFKVGSIVEPKKAEWGHGVVVHRSDDFAFVYFENQEDSIAKKFRPESLVASDITPDERLLGLGAELNTDGRYKVISGGKKITKKKVKKA